MAATRVLARVVVWRDPGIAPHMPTPRLSGFALCSLCLPSQLIGIIVWPVGASTSDGASIPASRVVEGGRSL